MLCSYRKTRDEVSYDECHVQLQPSDVHSAILLGQLVVRAKENLQLGVGEVQEPRQRAAADLDEGVAPHFRLDLETASLRETRAAGRRAERGRGAGHAREGLGVHVWIVISAHRSLSLHSADDVGARGTVFV